MDERQICLGLVSAGAMGSALGRARIGGGARAVTTIAGRSPRTADLAVAAGLELLPDLDAVVSAADIVVSVAPPQRAVPIAEDIARSSDRTGARPLVADVNAIAPSTLAGVASALAEAGLELVDGAISGGPPRPGGRTTLYLSGARAHELADQPATGLETVVVSDRIGDASAVKMCTASVYKGFTALLTQAMLTARTHGVEQLVIDDLHQAFPDEIDTLARTFALAASKASRFVGEMREIALTQGAAGARPELFEAMAEVWTMVDRRALARRTPEQAVEVTSLASVLDELARDA